MATQHTPVSVSQEDVQRAQHNWAGFTLMMKIGVVSVVILLGLMAVFIA